MVRECDMIYVAGHPLSFDTFHISGHLDLIAKSRNAKSVEAALSDALVS